MFFGALANTFIPVSGGDDEMGFFAVPVTGDWTDPDNCWTDIQTATGMESEAEEGYVIALTINLWEGDGDSDDFATLRIANGSPVYEIDSGPTPFRTPPSSGTAYIIGVTHTRYEDEGPM